MLVLFEQDSIVYPNISEHFGEIDAHKNILSMNQTRLYNEDWIGLKSLDDQEKVF